MKKPSRKAKTGNPAAAARKPPGPRPKDRWLSRELGLLLVFLALIALALWRWWWRHGSD